jgi:hypothetical protein
MGGVDIIVGRTNLLYVRIFQIEAQSMKEDKDESRWNGEECERTEE